MYQSLIKPLFGDIKKFVLDTLLPTKCLACQTEGEFICAECRSKLARSDQQFCIACQKPSASGVTHFSCQTPFGADGLVSLLDYRDENVAKLIITGKYSFIPAIYRTLGSLLAIKLKADYPDLLADDNYSLVPVPLSSWRERWRGFNQAQVLAETIGQQLNLPCTSVLVRCKSTKVQKDVKHKEQRAKNVEGAFTLSPLFAKEGVRGSSFILIDDVTTTGSTLLEAVKVLKRNGAKSVWCLTVARD